MKARIAEEVQLLREKFPKLEHGPEFEWVLLPHFALPKGRFNKATAPILFALPVGYPNTGPDNFFTDVDLRLANGSMPPAFNPDSKSSSGPAPVPGSWGWFSWHPQKWTPRAAVTAGDNLLVFVSGVQLCLRGEESP